MDYIGFHYDESIKDEEFNRLYFAIDDNRFVWFGDWVVVEEFYEKYSGMIELSKKLAIQSFFDFGGNVDA